MKKGLLTKHFGISTLFNVRQLRTQTTTRSSNRSLPKLTTIRPSKAINLFRSIFRYAAAVGNASSENLFASGGQTEITPTQNVATRPTGPDAFPKIRTSVAKRRRMQPHK